MKVIFKNAELVFARSLTKMTVHMSDIPSNLRTQGLLNSDGSGIWAVAGYYTTSEMQRLPVGATSISEDGLGYPAYDNHCTICVYDSSGNFVASGGYNHPIDLTQYPDAYYYKFSAREVELESGSLFIYY